MSLRLLHINIEEDKHLEKIFDLIEKEKPDVVCMQEVVYESWSSFLEKKAFYHVFSPMFKKDEKTHGVMILSVFPFEDVKSLRYDFGQKNDPLPLIEGYGNVAVSGTRSKERFNYHYPILNVSILFENKEINIATTHFPVADHIVLPNPYHHFCDMEHLRDLIYIRNFFDNLLERIKTIKNPFIFTADFNTPRGSFIYDQIATILFDCVPKDVKTTLDLKNHRFKDKLALVIDSIMISNEFNLSSFELKENVSDHKALIAEIGF